MISILLFLAVLLIVVGGINTYVFIRGLQAFPSGSGFRTFYIYIIWFLFLSFFAGRILESFWRSGLSDLLIWIGSFWLAALLYFFLAVVLLDILRAAHHFLPFFPSFVTRNYATAKQVLAFCLASLVSILLLAGYVNSVFPRVRTLNLAIEKKAGDLKKLDIVAISDIHIGTIVGRSRVSRIVDRINSLDPDIVLLPGDIVDEDISDPGNDGLGAPLNEIRSRFGVFAATGNHEYISGIEQATVFMAEHNIELLRDRAVKVADAFYIVGREDLMSNRNGKTPRKALEELMQDVDRDSPVIMMDHQPFRLQEAASAGVDLQLSGHTHYGQLWPINYIVRAIYEVAWGYKKIGDTHYYVSNGVGTWGPPLRIGNRPEIVHIRLKFK